MTVSRSQRGFTLLEALVVLMITAMVAVVLVQGFGLLLGTRTAVQDKLVAVNEAVLEQSLFLEPIRGIVPDYPERPHIFVGEPERLHGITVRPLQARTGTPVPFTLTLSYDPRTDRTSLTYQEENTPPLVVGGWAGRKGAFAYRDLTGNWLEAWPPKNSLDAPQTPWLIRLEKGSGFPTNMVASVGGTHRRALRFRDTPFGPETPMP